MGTRTEWALMDGMGTEQDGTGTEWALTDGMGTDTEQDLTDARAWARNGP